MKVIIIKPTTESSRKNALQILKYYEKVELNEKSNSLSESK